MSCALKDYLKSQSLLQNPAAHSGSKVYIITAMGKSQCVFALSVYLAAFFG